MNQVIFKTCTCCNHTWSSREQFLSDRTLDLNGYQADYELLEEGLFFFTHNIAECGSTLAICARDFMDLYSGPRYSERHHFDPECPRACDNKSNLERCEVACECAVVREVMRLVKRRLRGGSLQVLSV